MPGKQEDTAPLKEAATHPEAGSGLQEDKSFGLDQVGKDRDRRLEGAKGGGGDGGDPASAHHLSKDAEPDIAADDAGASAMAERAQKRSEGLENDG